MANYGRIAKFLITVTKENCACAFMLHVLRYWWSFRDVCRHSSISQRVIFPPTWPSQSNYYSLTTMVIRAVNENNPEKASRGEHGPYVYLHTLKGLLSEEEKLGTMLQLLSIVLPAKTKNACAQWRSDTINL